MKCLNNEKIIKYIDNELTGHDYKLVGKHLKSCPDCRVKYEDLLEKINLIRSSLDELNPQSVSIPTFRHPETERKRRKYGFLKPAMAVLSALIITLASYRIITKDDGNENMVQMEYALDQDMDITNPNVMWHERRLIITILDTRDNTCKKIVTSKDENNIRIKEYELQPDKTDNNF